MAFMFSSSSERNLIGVHPDLCRVPRLAIRRTSIDFGISRGLRTDMQQHAEFEAGKSNCDGYTNRSKHQVQQTGYAHAFDFFAYVDGRANYDPLYMSIVATFIYQAASDEGVKIRWGGMFKPYKAHNDVILGWDLPHIELVE